MFRISVSAKSCCFALLSTWGLTYEQLDIERTQITLTACVKNGRSTWSLTLLVLCTSLTAPQPAANSVGFGSEFSTSIVGKQMGLIKSAMRIFFMREARSRNRHNRKSLQKALCLCVYYGWRWRWIYSVNDDFKETFVCGAHGLGYSMLMTESVSSNGKWICW